MNFNLSITFMSCYTVVGILITFNAIAFETVTIPRLGSHPLCEASAARFIACPDGQGECLLVGDNEQKDKLFLLHADQILPYVIHQQSLPFGSEEIADIEALVNLSSSKIIVFGSHSRNSKCEAKKNRRRFASISITETGISIDNFVKSQKITCERIFGTQANSQSLLHAICREIEQAEEQAKVIEKKLEDEEIKSKEARLLCNKVAPFNAEGALALAKNDSTNIWIGLRSPLLSAHPDSPEYSNLAILLRLKNLSEYSFDNITLLDLGGRGVRELIHDGDWIWVVAGPPLDQVEPFQLWRFRASALVPEAIINPELIATLPPSSEGLAINGKTAYVLIDGDIGDSESHCQASSRFMLIDLPE